MAIEPPVIEWWAEAVKMILPLSGIGCGWKLQCGAGRGVAPDRLRIGAVGPHGQRFWCVTASRSI